MKINDFEKDILVKFFEIREINAEKILESIGDIEVLKRDYTPCGFFTEFRTHECLKVENTGRDYTWGEIGAKLNEEKIEVAFLFYIRRGYLEMIEGYTFGEQIWPKKIKSYEIFKINVHYIKNGKLLKQPPPESGG